MTTPPDQRRVGDLVDIDGGLQGVVVFNSVISDWSSEFPENEWSYMEEEGIKIRQGNGAFVFHSSDDFSEGAGRVIRVERF